LHNENVVDRYVERMVAAAPPLTDAQRCQLAELLRPVRRSAQAPDTAVAA
jgi:hypothetical protein